MKTIAEQFAALGLVDAGAAAQVTAQSRSAIESEATESHHHFMGRMTDELAAVRRERHRQMQEARRHARESYAAQATSSLHSSQQIEYLSPEEWKKKATYFGEKVAAAKPELRGHHFRVAVEKAMRRWGFALKIEEAA